MAVLPTSDFQHLCDVLGVAYEGFNCGMFAAAKEMLLLMTVSDVNEILGTDFDEIDIVCDVTVFRMTRAGNLQPGEGSLPGVDIQRADKAELVRLQAEVFRQFCLDNPGDPACAEQQGNNYVEGEVI